MYTSYTFYKDTYCGDVVPESDFSRLCTRASDFLDSITFDRLADGLPTAERSQQKIQKAVCAMCDALYQLEQAEKNAIAAAAAAASSTSSSTSGRTVASMSSGTESVSYASSSDLASGAKNWSALYSVAGDEAKTQALLYAVAQPYLRGVCNEEGICLLFAGAF